MLDFGRSSKASLLARFALLAFGPIGIAGCGGDDEPSQSAAEAPAAAPAGHDMASAPPAAGHGAPAAHAAHGVPNPVASADPHGMHASSAVAHGQGAHGADSSAAMPSLPAAGAHAAHGAPGGAAVAAHGAHGAGSSAGPSSAHDSSGQVTSGGPMPHAVPSSVPTAHDAGGLVTSGGAAAHGGPPGSPAAHGVPMTSGGSSAGAVAGHGASSAAGGHAQSAVPGVGAVDSSGAPAGHGQMAPGAAGVGVPEGYAGSDIPGATAPQQTFEEGTAEYAVQQLVLKMQAGNTEDLDKLISDKTKDGILQPLLDGEADEEQIQKNKELVAGATLASRRDSGSSKLFVVNNAEGKVLTFTARKDGEAYKVVNIRVETPRGLKARQQPGF